MERNVGDPSNKLQNVIIGVCLGIPVTIPEIVVLVVIVMIQLKCRTHGLAMCQFEDTANVA